jgi:AcrR family transcriptional regulator
MARAIASRSPRWSRRKLERPNEILDAAVLVFAEKGFAAARMEDIASRAGVTKGTIYLYFKSKEEVFKSLVRESIVPTVAATAASAHDFEGRASDLIKLVIGRIADFLLTSDRIVLPKIILAETGNFPELARFYRVEVVDRGVALLTGIIEKGIIRGEFRKLPADHIAKLCMAPVILVVLWRTTFARFDREPFDYAGFLRTHLDVLLKGLEPGPGE